MRKKYARLHGIQPDRQITEEEDGAFLHHFKHALLLALKGEGLLSENQYHIAVEELNRSSQNLCHETMGRKL